MGKESRVVTYAEKLKELRLSLDLNKRDMSLKCGLHHNKFSVWENYSYCPNAKSLNKIIKALQLSDDFFDDCVYKDGFETKMKYARRQEIKEENTMIKKCNET